VPDEAPGRANDTQRCADEGKHVPVLDPGDLQAPSTEVDDRPVPQRSPAEGRPRAEPCFLVPAENPNLGSLDLSQGREQVCTVAGLPYGRGGDDNGPGRSPSRGVGHELAGGTKGLVHGPGGQGAGPATAQTRLRPLLVENAKALATPNPHQEKPSSVRPQVQQRDRLQLAVVRDPRRHAP